MGDPPAAQPAFLCASVVAVAGRELQSLDDCNGVALKANVVQAASGASTDDCCDGITVHAKVVQDDGCDGVTVEAEVVEEGPGTPDEPAEASEQRLERLRQRLASAQGVGRAWKRRVRWPLLVAGTTLVPGGGICWLTLASSPLQSVAVFISGLGCVVSLLAVLPTDHIRIKWVARLWLFVPLLTALMQVSMLLRRVEVPCSAASSPVPNAANLIHVATFGLCILSWAFLAAWLIRHMCGRPARLLEKLWWSLGAYSATYAVQTAVHAPLLWPCGQGEASLTRAVWCTLIALMCWCPRLRVKVQACLAWRGGTAAPVAHIAELLGDRPIGEAIESAKATFRFVTGDHVTLDSLANNRPDAPLRDVTLHGQFGCVDAFVSHSWHDDPGLKWAALQEWRAAFSKCHGREPRLWVDKYCIDPDNLEEGLRCLPLFVAGCNTLLVLCGPTYLQRAWCLLEIFAFMAMGGDLDAVQVKLLPPCDGVTDGFDAAQAKCALDKDAARLQEIFTTGFSHAENLTGVVKAALNRGHQGGLRALVEQAPVEGRA